MSTEQPSPAAPTSRAPAIVGGAAIAIVMFGAGMLLQSHFAGQTAAAAKLAHEQELKQVEDKAEEQKQALTERLGKERDEHANAIQTKDRNLASLAHHAAGVRNALETDLSAARASGSACTSRIDGITQALDGVFDSIGQVTGIAQDLGRENQQLKEDNKTLSTKLAGWQKWNSERMSRITITGKKLD